MRLRWRPTPIRNGLSGLAAARPALGVVVAAVLMTMAPGRLVVESQLQNLDRSSRSASGMTAAWALLGWMRATQLHRGLTTAVQSGNEPLRPRQAQAQEDLRTAAAGAASAVARLGQPRLTQHLDALAGRAAALVRAAGSPSADAWTLFTAHTDLVGEQIELLEDVRAATGLSQHDDSAVHHLEGAALHQLPLLAESLGRVRGLGMQRLGSGPLAARDLPRLVAELAIARDALRRADKALDLATRGAGAAEPALRPAIAAAVAARDRAVALAEAVIAGPSDTRPDPVGYFDGMSHAIDAQYALIHHACGLLQARIEAAAVAARRRFALEIAAMAGLCLLGVALLLSLERVRRAQRASDARARAILDAAPDALVLGDARGIVVLANRAAHRLFQRDAQAWAGMPLRSLTAPDTPIPLPPGPSETAAAVDPAPHEFVAVRGDGSRFPAEMSCSFFGESGDRRVVLAVRDLSERRRSERQASHSRKMEALGQLTGGIAHDFNNLLAVIVGNLDLLARAPSIDGTARRRVDTAQKAALRGADLTRRLLAFSRRQPLAPAPLGLREAVANVVEMAARTLGPDIRVHAPSATDATRVLADAAALENALLNLLLNARDAMPDGGSITIGTQTVERDADHAAVRSGELAAGRYVLLRVTDTGHGIPREHVERVFDPFFTTKPPGQGTGLGLAMVYGFARQSGGAVSLDSEVGVGTTVTLALPATDRPVPAASPPAAPGPQHRAPTGRTALVVDDEPELLEVAASHLSDMGYRVLTAGSGSAALAVLTGDVAVALLVTDVIMPGGINGVRLGQYARQHQPGIRVVFMSGHPSQALAQQRGPRVDAPVLTKPYLQRDLAAAVARVMEEETA